MKNVLTKIGYMVIGSLLTILGYHFGSIDNNSVNAQETSQTPVEIVDKLRVRQLEIVGNDNSPRIYMGTDLDRAEIKFVGDTDTSQISLKATSDGGQIKLHNRSGKQKIHLGLSKDRGRILILGEDGLSKVTLDEDEDGGVVQVNSHENNSGVGLRMTESGGLVAVVDSSGAAVLLHVTDGIGSVVTLNKDGTIRNSMGGKSTAPQTQRKWAPGSISPVHPGPNR